MSDLEADLKKLAETIRSQVNKGQTKANTSTPAPVDLYPTALSNHEAHQIGVIVDDSYDVKELLKAGKINPADKLNWVQCKTYEEFEGFINNRGIPAYVSFDGDLGKGKNGIDCANLLVKACKEAKLKDLPRWECHSPVVTSKDKIETILLAY